ncbi:MAG: MFS transporter [Deltaproteobacteria bacterium]|nr:MFS transporter [Deltaproteobacteria bacterium]
MTLPAGPRFYGVTRVDGRWGPVRCYSSSVLDNSSKQADYSRPYVLYAIFVVFLVSVFNVVDRYILSILASDIKRDLGLSDTQMGLLLGPSFSVVHFIAVLPAAWLADRYARRTVVAGGLFLWSAMTAVGGLVTGFGALFATRMGVGVGEAAGSPPSVALLSDTAPPHWRTRALSAVTVGALVGLALGMILGGYLGAAYGWRVALLSVGLTGLPVALLVRFTLREPPRSQGSRVSPLAAARHLFSFGSFRWSVLGICLANIAISGRNLWEPSFLERSYGLSGAELGFTYVVISGIPSMIGALAGATLADRLSTRDVRWLVWVAGGAIALAVPFIVVFLTLDSGHVVEVGFVGFPLAYVFSALGSFFLGFFSPPMASLAQSLATPQIRSLAHAIWTMPYTLIGMGVGPLLVGTLSEWLTPSEGQEALRLALIASCVLLPAGAIGFFVAGRTLVSDLERVEGSKAGLQ